MIRFFPIWILALLGQLLAQPYPAARSLPAHMVVPQSRSFAVDSSSVQITRVDAAVEILEQAAVTTMDVSLFNPGRLRLEAELFVPVPDGAVVKGFTFQGAAGEPLAQLLPKEEAHRIYDAIVAKVRDPALLEFIGYNTIRSSVFPVEAGSSQKVRLTYEHLLPADGNRIDYVLPRTESLKYNVPWQVSVKIKSAKAIATVYSPSHKLDVNRISSNSFSTQIAADSKNEPGPFRLSYLLEDNAISASLFAYPDPAIHGGYFLLLAGVPNAPAGRTSILREVTIVIDRSGSMAGEKLRQVREAALQVVEGLRPGEAFNIIVYNQAVESFAPYPVLKDDDTSRAAALYLKSVLPQGGTNIYDALLESLLPKPRQGMLPIVLFLTDGLPTIGQTSETAICNLASSANKYRRRMFTFGVGVDVNTPLLEKIAVETRGTAAFVLPQEDVELKVAQVFKRLSGPVLAWPELGIVREDGKPAFGRVQDIIPTALPDLFDGDRLVLLGRYVGETPISFEIRGNYLGTQRSFRYTFDLDKATARNSFVPRLWASRKIAVLIDAIRQLGADSPVVGRPNPGEARLKELVDEVVRLSTEFGILTEYTAFLAREGSDIGAARAISEAENNFRNRALYSRSGMESVNQEINNQQQRSQSQLNRRNSYFDRQMNRVDVANVQQVSDRTFYQRNGRWVDSRILQQESEIRPQKIIHFGSEEFREFALKLAKDGRQGVISLTGDVLFVVDGEPVLIKGMTAK